MSELKIITKESTQAELEKNKTLPNRMQMAQIVTPGVSLESNKRDSNFKALENASVLSNAFPTQAKIDEYGSSWDMPKMFGKEGEKVEMTTREAIKSGKVFASGNTLPQDWQTLWDALRIDISIKVSGQGTVRQNFYKMLDMPNSTKLFNITEFYPYYVPFVENNGEGQAVKQGETRAGQNEVLEHLIYAAGFTWTLLAELFANSIDPERITDAVTVGYDSKRDDLSMSPILDFSYSGDQQTEAATLSGANRQELLYLTLENAIDDLGERKDPIRNREIGVNDLVLLAGAYDARHIQKVATGLPSTNERTYDGISEISSIVAYEGETLEGRVEVTEYAGVTKGTAYLVKKNRYMNIGLKRNLTIEVDQQPDVSTFSQKKTSYYFSEAQQTTGISDFVQEITLPAW